jgi:translation initiation factor 2 alpha subunit (eIF-2alpha)
MVKPKLEEGQLVLCTVTKIIGTTVFVQIDDYSIEGTISFPEIAPGRIRNIREYAFPGKKIVCKVLNIRSQGLELSFRRVKVNERNDFNDRYKRERNYLAMFRTIVGEKFLEIIEKIREEQTSFIDFIEESKEDIVKLEKYITKEQAEKIISILKEKKAKETTLNKKFSLSSKSSNGMIQVKKAISEASSEIPKENFEVSYIAAGKYYAKIKSKDAKLGDQQLRKFLENLETFAKKNNCEFNEIKD